MAEQEFVNIYPAAAICRMPWIFGACLPVSKSFLQTFIESLTRGKNFNSFTDEFRTPVSGITAARGLLLALEKQVTGILNLGGKERIYRYYFGRLLVEILEISESQIIVCRQHDVRMSAPRPADVYLDSSQAIQLGYSPLFIRE